MRILLHRTVLAVAWVIALATGSLPVGAQPGIRPAGAAGTGLSNAWGGGLNACQFCEIDLNLDGKKDLLVFDRHGYRKLTYINYGSPGVKDLRPDNAFARRLPELREWVRTVDYDGDGRMDLFTYFNGGVRVFQNISDTVLTFRKVTDLLESYYYTGKVGVLVTSVDYPAIADADGDGDPDLLTFFGLGSWVEYHRNLSMEKYGNRDSLDFRLEDPCWGKFRESESGHQVTLGAPCPYREDDPLPSCRRQPPPRHTGSTLLARDLNGDGLTDLALGDVDYPDIIALYNGGSPDTAFMVSADTAFPAGDAIRLFSFPVLSEADPDNDGLPDLLVSPFDPALYIAENDRCVAGYRNTGTVSAPVYSRQPGTPFRDDMLDFGTASRPFLHDMNGDGRPDLLVGNYGTYDSSWYFQGTLRSAFHSSIAVFLNTGAPANPLFTRVTCPGLDLPGSVALTGLSPCAGDVNGDGFPDIIAGRSDGTLLLLLNRSEAGPVPAFAPPVVNWQGIDVGDYSAPQLFDLDRDGRTDLVIGERSGNLNYYRNTGTPTDPVFVFVSDSLGGILVTNPAISWDGYSVPCLARDETDAAFLVVGSEEGRLRLFGSIDGNLSGKFTEETGLFQWLAADPADSVFGWRTAPALGRLTGSPGFDLITGNFSGGLNFISKGTPPVVVPGYTETDPSEFRLSVVPNPASTHVVVTRPVAGRAGFRECSGPLFLTDPWGRSLAFDRFPESIQLDVSHLTPGIYLLHSGTCRARLIILRP